MAQKKYKLTDETRTVEGHILHRIKALRDVWALSVHVKAGDLGGWVESENNLAQEGECWIYGNAMVYDAAAVVDNAVVMAEAVVHGKACIHELARISGHAVVSGFSSVSGTASITEYASVNGWPRISGDAVVFGSATVTDYAEIWECSHIFGNAKVAEWASIHGNARISGKAVIKGDAEIVGGAYISGNAEVNETSDYALYYATWHNAESVTYTRSNKTWDVGTFRGSGEDLIAMANAIDHRVGKCFENLVQAQEAIDAAINQS